MKSNKIAALALLSAFAVPAFAADVITSDGRLGGSFWNQPIQRGGNVAAHPIGQIVIGEINPTDGRLGGFILANTQPASMAAANEQFVATSQVSHAYGFLEDYNP